MINELLKLIRNETAPLRRRVMGLVSRGTLRVVDDTKTPQAVQIELQDGEVSFPIEHLQPFGFSSVPPVNADALHVSIGANRANGIVLFANAKQARPTAQLEGTVCLYTTNAMLVRLLPDGTVELGESPTEYAARADKVADEINKIKDKLNTLITTYNAHTHAGVTSGGGTTATPSATATSASATTATANACEKVKAL